MRRAVLAGLLFAACSGKKEAAPAPSTGSAPIAAVVDAAPAVPAADRFRTLIVPDIAADARPDAVAEAPIVLIAVLQVSFEGAPVVRIMGGKIDPKAIDDQRHIAALTELYGAYAKAAAPPHVNVAAMPQGRAGVLLDVMGSIAAAGQDHFALLVRTPEGAGALPIRWRAMRGDPATVRLVVSEQQVEATVGDVKARFPLMDTTVWVALRAYMVEQAAAAPTVAVAVTDGARVQDLASTLVAVRQHNDGKPLFTDIALEREADAVATGPTSPPPGSDVDRAALAEEAQRYADLLTASGEEDHRGDLSGEIRKTAPGTDLGAQIDQVRADGARVEVGSGGMRGAPSPLAGTGTSIGSGPDVLYAEEKPPDSRIAIRDKQAFDDTSLTADVVLGKISAAYMAGIKRCYKQGLKTDTTLQGRVAVNLTVNETGRVGKHGARGFNDAIDRCIDGLMDNWRFAIPKDADGEATEASFKFTLELKTE